jgi:ribosomal-protein-alanine N-acetyltransferase
MYSRQGSKLQPSLQSNRLLLRPYCAADAPSVQRLAGDPRIASTTTTIPHPYPNGAAEAWIATHQQSYEDGTSVTYAITLRDSGGLVGSISLLDISRKHARAELGYWVGAEFWGAGYCTEAVSRVIPFAREHFSVTKLVAWCFARNPASARVMHKAGMTQEGCLAKHTLKNGTWEDMLVYGLVLPGRE